MTTAAAANELRLPPGRSKLPLIGETLSFLRDLDFATKRYQRYGSIFRTHLFGRPTVYIVDVSPRAESGFCNDPDPLP